MATTKDEKGIIKESESNEKQTLLGKGCFFKYKDFSLVYTYTNGIIYEHPMTKSDIKIKKFVSVISFDDKGFFYKIGDSQETKYILLDDLDFFVHNNELIDIIPKNG